MDPQPLPSCALDDPGLAAQGARYAAIGAAATRVERTPGRLLIELGADTDAATLHDLIATERACCPFFRLDLSDNGRHLTIGVDDPAHSPALDAIEAQIRSRGCAGARQGSR